MKRIAILVAAALCISAQPALADEPPNLPAEKAAPNAIVATLNAQAKTLADATQARDTRPIHQIDEAVSAETAAWQKAASSLSAEQKAKLDALYADLAKQASRAHHSGHKNDWDDVAAAQKAFAADVRQVEAIQNPVAPVLNPQASDFLPDPALPC